MRRTLLILVLALLISVVPALAQDAVELRITWYSDGVEGEVMQDLLDRFMEANPNITVVLDSVDYATGIQQTLPLQLEAGEGPDIARVTNLGGLSQYYLDIRPYLSDPEYWEENFGATLDWLRPEGDTEGIYGFPTQLTVTGPYINRTLFDQAGVAVPSDDSDEVTWEEWAAAANEVASALDIQFPMAMDRSGHRFAGPAISMGAQLFDEEGHPTVTDEGFRAMAELLVNWHADGTMLPDIWVGNAGTYAAANEQFVNGEVVFYMSGSWQIGQFANLIGDAFDWEAVPNPCGPAACTGMPGGAALVAIATTEHPEEVALLLDWLASEEVLGEFSARSLFIPAHAGLAAAGVDFDTDVEAAKAALDTFVAQVAKLSPIAYQMQGYRNNTLVLNAIRDRLTQAITGELTLDEAITRIQDDIDTGLEEQE